MYIVNVIEIETEKVVHTIESKSFFGANRVEDGILINLDSEKYYTEIEKITSSNNKYTVQPLASPKSE